MQAPLPRSAPAEAEADAEGGARGATGTRRGFALSLLAILALAFGLRVGVAEFFQGLDAPPDAGAQPDQVDYELLAYHLSVGEGYTLDGERPTALRPPGTSLALLPAYVAFGRDRAAGRAWFALLSALTVLFAALFAARAFGRPAGLIAGLWLALYPGHFYYPMHYVSEVPYALALAVACYAALRATGARGVGWACAAGLALGAATLTRPQALLAVPLAGLVALALPGRASAARWKGMAAGLLGFALALAPWLVRNQVQLGHASLSSIGGCTFWGAHNERVLADPALRGYWLEVTELADAEHPLSGDEFEVESACWSYGLAFVRENAAAMPGLVAAKLARFLTPFEPIPSPLAYWCFAIGWILSAPLALAGLVLAWRARRDAALALVVPLLATFATVVVFYGSGRFRDSIAAVLAAPIGLAAARALRALRARRAAA